jgi:recombination protein RecR
MSQSNDPIRTLVGQFSRLPGIGEKTATRLVYALIRGDREVMRSLADALSQVAGSIHECVRCCAISADPGECPDCANHARDGSILCVVSDVQDMLALERTAEFTGRYHVLHGSLAPLDGVGPEELRIRELLLRLGSTDQDVQEIILANPPTVDGEATALYLARQMKHIVPKITRIASGIPVGGDLQYADRLTLGRAMQARRTL